MCGLGGTRHVLPSELMRDSAWAPEAVVPDAKRVAAGEQSFQRMTIDG